MDTLTAITSTAVILALCFAGLCLAILIADRLVTPLLERFWPLQGGDNDT